MPRVFTSLAAGLSGILHGYALSGLSLALGYMKELRSLTTKDEEIIIGVTALAAAPMAIVSSGLNDMFGRRKVILISSTIAMIGGAFGLVTDENKHYIIVNRVVTGFGIGEESDLMLSFSVS